MIMLASLSVVHAIHGVTGLKAEIKWPNDILLNCKKVSGILIENDVLGKTANTIIGIGIDVNLRVADFPEIRDIATSLAEELGEDVSRLKLIQSLLVEMESLYMNLQDTFRRDLFEEWRENLVTLGKQVRVTGTDAVYEGIAESVAEDGSLLLRESDGNLRRIVAGDVTLRD
jgi:BirA family biotin operon repressor/biotin-[acetyl-CoA-carboxylase] ligase